jgi:thiosulfate/3-mercaptopyruvate sulfurtransferase
MTNGSPTSRWLVTTAWLAERLGAPSTVVVDGSFYLPAMKRDAAAEYLAGHIPGAVNVDSAAFYDSQANRLKPQSELVAIAAALPSAPAVTYCNTGHWAATDWFVLSELLGRKDVRLYSGSMVEWTTDASRPLASARTKWDDLKKTLGFGS